ncbi:hypothetical protein [Qipengyuania sp.]|uniref:hypothetical protein n=1 Tax=Qipengyuania sp. TaxID=2004515 RepID=UPI0035C7E3B8
MPAFDVPEDLTALTSRTALIRLTRMIVTQSYINEAIVAQLDLIANGGKPSIEAIGDLADSCAKLLALNDQVLDDLEKVMK